MQITIDKIKSIKGLELIAESDLKNLFNVVKAQGGKVDSSIKSEHEKLEKEFLEAKRNAEEKVFEKVVLDSIKFLGIEISKPTKKESPVSQSNQSYQPQGYNNGYN